MEDRKVMKQPDLERFSVRFRPLRESTIVKCEDEKVTSIAQNKHPRSG